MYIKNYLSKNLIRKIVSLALSLGLISYGLLGINTKVQAYNVTEDTTTSNSRSPNTGILLSKLSDKLIVGETDTLTATVIPSDAIYKDITWASSHPDVVTVSSGNLKAVSPGISLITATAGDKTAFCTVVVDSLNSVESLSLDKTSDILPVGGVDILIATITPINALNKEVILTSSNPLVVSVHKNRLLIAMNPGTATITATTVDGGKTATCVVTVRNPESK
ncbi:Ig-like domain-containing protein [Clostridium sp. OS1-26]|uniref:Ig-like domain-containing protein n=1 Tax=Clostridium sp. OS1-26 TaxID=3070681 RepID=UPI0027DED11F|nr:Ig-like domain-containing protein [Clostridium sp. OS1-26]WML33202.1 Ig-like domain-containing protein [Clostridium sp. OS1-26]